MKIRRRVGNFATIAKFSQPQRKFRSGSETQFSLSCQDKTMHNVLFYFIFIYFYYYFINLKKNVCFFYFIFNFIKKKFVFILY